MQNVAKVLGVLVLAVAVVFGYFLQKSNWDFTLAKSMVTYEINKLMGSDKPAPVSVETAPAETAQEEAPAEAAPSQPAHSKDSIYKDKGNSFSDMKRTGNESTYESKN